jgi:hypothetical protein
MKRQKKKKRFGERCGAREEEETAVNRLRVVRGVELVVPPMVGRGKGGVLTRTRMPEF